MMCILQSMKAMKDSQQQQEYISIIDAASVAALHIADNTTVQALLYVAMSEDQGKDHSCDLCTFWIKLLKLI